MKSALVRIVGFPATLVHGDTLILDRWRWLVNRLPAVPRGSKTLIDVGCGTGAFTIGVARRGYRSLGLSWDERNQSVAAKRAAICHADLASFEVLDVRNLGSREDLKGKFDIAICFECIEHILNDQKLMVDIAGCLKPGGKLYLTTPNLDLRPMIPGDATFAPIENGGHVRRGYSPDDLKRISAGAGLDVEEIAYCSGLLSQKLTGAMRIIGTYTRVMVAWAIVLPLRVFPPLFDGVVARLTGWPDYSIALVARKPPGAAKPLGVNSAVQEPVST